MRVLVVEKLSQARRLPRFAALTKALSSLRLHPCIALQSKGGGKSCRVGRECASSSSFFPVSLPVKSKENSLISSFLSLVVVFAV